MRPSCNRARRQGRLQEALHSVGITTGSGWAAEPSPGDSPQGRSAEEGIDPPEPQPGGLLFLAAAKLTLCRGFAHVVPTIVREPPAGRSPASAAAGTEVPLVRSPGRRGRGGAPSSDLKSKAFRVATARSDRFRPSERRVTGSRAKRRQPAAPLRAGAPPPAPGGGPCGRSRLRRLHRPARARHRRGRRGGSRR